MHRYEPTQDHRGVNLRIGPMLGFKRFETAAVTIAGIEFFRRIHKRRSTLGAYASTSAVWNGVLAAA